MDTLYAKDSPFTVVDNLSVPSGVTAHIEPGCIIRFKAGLGLTVNGNLKAIGTADSPIIFTSINDPPSGEAIEDRAGGQTSDARLPFHNPHTSPSARHAP